MLQTFSKLIAIAGLLTACGNDENSIPYRAPQKTSYLKQSLQDYAVSLSEQGKSHTTTVSSLNIRQETIGLNIDILGRGAKSAELKVTLSYSQSPQTCNQAIYSSASFDASRLSQVGVAAEIEDFGRISCLEYDSKAKRCNSLFVMIRQTPSSIVSERDPLALQNSGIVPAAVFVTMENRSTSTTSDHFIPAQFEFPNFLQVPQNATDFQFCMKPQLILTQASQIYYPINPVGDLDADFLSEDYNNNYNFGGFYK